MVRRPIAARKQFERMPQPFGDLLSREHPDRRCRELYRERYAVQLRTYLRHGRGVLGCQLKARMPIGGTISEQPRRLKAFELLDSETLLRVGHRERGHEPAKLARHAQRLPAGGE